MFLYWDIGSGGYRGWLVLTQTRQYGLFNAGTSSRENVAQFLADLVAGDGAGALWAPNGTFLEDAPFSFFINVPIDMVDGNATVLSTGSAAVDKVATRKRAALSAQG